jgi:hypothetical protein
VKLIQVLKIFFSESKITGLAPIALFSISFLMGYLQPNNVYPVVEDRILTTQTWQHLYESDQQNKIVVFNHRSLENLIEVYRSWQLIPVFHTGLFHGVYAGRYGFDLSLWNHAIFDLIAIILIANISVGLTIEVISRSSIKMQNRRAELAPLKQSLSLGAIAIQLTVVVMPLVFVGTLIEVYY